LAGREVNEAKRFVDDALLVQLMEAWVKLYNVSVSTAFRQEKLNVLFIERAETNTTLRFTFFKNWRKPTWRTRA
jgi:hypothetical protein